MSIGETISTLKDASHIGEEAASLAIEMHKAGDGSHTIGFEAEVLESARDDIPNITGSMDNYDEPHQAAAPDLIKYGFGVARDGLYELQSPAAKHPYPLAVAAQGIAKAGWLPEDAKGMVTAHVSIGTWRTEKELYSNGTLPAIVNMLRAVDMTGGTTPGRLIAPVKQASEFAKQKGELEEHVSSRFYSWNMRGTAGVLLGDRGKNWQGRNTRLELRTIRYSSPEQFGQTLARIYFLSRGLLDKEGTPGRELYDNFASWFKHYMAENGLTDFNDINGDEEKAQEITYIPGARSYLEPFAIHMKKKRTDELAAKVDDTVDSLQEVYFC